jgi:hypothetical protein
MSDGKYSVLFYISIAAGVFASFNGMAITATLWMIASAIYLVGGDIIKELRKR